MFKAINRYFLPPQKPGQPSSLLIEMENKTLVAFIVATIVGFIVVIPIVVLSYWDENIFLVQTISASLAWIVVQVSFLLWFKRGGNRAVIVSGTLGVLLMLLSFTSFTSGGIHAIEVPVILLIPVIAQLTLGGSAGFGWLFLAISVFLILGISPSFGKHFVAPIDSAAFALNASLFLIGMAGILLALVRISHRASVRMQNSLQTIALEEREKARRDGLTGVLNRNAIIEVAGHQVAISREAGYSCPVAVIDLVGFKAINDLNGHPAGDELLVDVTQRLLSVIGEQGHVGRLGGDEFCVVWKAADVFSSHQAAAEQIASAFVQPFNMREQAISVGASVGVAVYPFDGKELIQLYEVADARMYAMKRRTRETAAAS